MRAASGRRNKNTASQRQNKIRIKEEKIKLYICWMETSTMECLFLLCLSAR